MRFPARPPAGRRRLQYNYDSVPLLGFQIPILGDTNSTSVPLQQMDDVRNAISLQVPVTLGTQSHHSAVRLQ